MALLLGSNGDFVTYKSHNAINATVNGPACPRIARTRPHGIPPSILLPLVVWIHDEALTQGNSWFYAGNGMVQQSMTIVSALRHIFPHDGLDRFF
ncbi:hypothetical protein H2248_010440 [Termitomyces sp. 'cryptogamus']|nr:hypothetical protein H2248_010440 [Termitomyces sp. 'cryptogamus']